jgi:transposase InsO family protein
MRGLGNCFDNAPEESFFGTLKAELVNHAVYRTRQEAMTDIFFYLEGFYNRTRRHSALAFLSPANFEATCGQQPVFESFEFLSIKPG